MTTIIDNMNHPIYNDPGKEVYFPEISSALAITDSKFIVLNVFEGGMGICLHLVTSDRKFQLALKSPLPQLLGAPGTYSRFIDELQVWLAASSCSFIAEALAVVSINGLPCVCATWMNGGDYASKISALSPSLHITNLVRIVRGLSWAYNNLGVIHRDLKPQNILLDESNLAYVADWGLARPVAQQLERINSSDGRGLPDRLDRTAIGSFLGTILYAAPEQIRGDKNIDFRADVYALGCIMYEMVTGSAPFPGPTREIVAYHHLNTIPDKINGRQNSPLTELHSVIARCLEKKPEKRYSSYDLLEKDLLKFLGKTETESGCLLLRERYRRNVLGRGVIKITDSEKDIRCKQKNKDFDFDKAYPHVEEALNLMSLERYEDARVILEKFYIPDFLEQIAEWDYQHNIALNLALCITRIDLSPQKAINIFKKLSLIPNKPATFYVNYSLVLLREGKFASLREAVDVCERGLRHYPNDLDIIGNRTIALTNSGDLDAALASAFARLKLRRDIHSIEEIVSIFKRLIILYNSDLPKILEHAKVALELIDEGLFLNPNFDSLRLLRFEILMECGLYMLASRAYKSLNDRETVNLVVMRSADCLRIRLMDTIGESKDALKLIRNIAQHMKMSPFKEELRFLDNDIISRKFMIGMRSPNGNKMILPTVVDFFLKENFDEKIYNFPCHAASILEWIDRVDEAIDVLSNEIDKNQKSWLAANYLGQMLSRKGFHDKAVQWADYIIQLKPWEIESYNIATYINKNAGDASKVNLLQTEWSRVLKKVEILKDNFTSFYSNRELT